MLRFHVIKAVLKRNLQSYFTGVLGYLFIVVYVVACAYLAFSPQFFTNNLANLDQLNEWFPLLLLFIVPAITMSTWADEKKLGTAELLFTLPATDLEILLGKYLAVLAVFTATLLFSLTQLCILGWYADPDWGMLFTTYVGYWMAGAALLSAGMFASVLTSSTTVAFVLGVAICAVPVFIGHLAPIFGDFFRGLSLSEQFREFGMGVLPVGGILYFVSLTVFMLYLNLVMISERHWSGGKQANMGLQFLVRAASLAAVLISINAMAGFASVRPVDMTAENIYSISDATRKLIKELDPEQKIEIQAFVSPEVPGDYVPARKQLLGLLRQYDRDARQIDVRYVDVELYSEEAEQAELFGIEPVTVHSERDGRLMQEDIYLGAVVSSPHDVVVIPFVGPGTPVEYELTRSIRTVSTATRPTVGVLRTDADVVGGSRDWQIVTELKKQYKVEDVSPDAAIDEQKYDVLIAVMPSSLTEPQMTNFVDYVTKGKPTLIFDDPYPLIFRSMFGVSMAPRLPKPSPGGGGMMGMQRPQAPPKADDGKATTLLNVLEIAWDNGEIVFDDFNPHPRFMSVPPEFLFISPDNVKGAFSEESEITSGLQEMLAFYSGRIRPYEDSKSKFQPLLRTGLESGLLQWDDYTASGFDMSRFSSTARLKSELEVRSARVQTPRSDIDAHVLAAHVTGGEHKVNVVYVADIDLISDWFFDIRTQGEVILNVDNVPFLLNAVDVLAGDEAFVKLRKRRAEHRTLKVLEEEKQRLYKERDAQQEEADEDATKALETAQQRFDDRVKEIESDEDLDEESKDRQIRQIRALEQRRIAVDRENIELKKNRKMKLAEAETQRNVRTLENWWRFKAVLLSPLPAVLLGVVVLSLRVYNERRDITPDRLVRG